MRIKSVKLLSVLTFLLMTVTASVAAPAGFATQQQSQTQGKQQRQAQQQPAATDSQQQPATADSTQQSQTQGQTTSSACDNEREADFLGRWLVRADTNWRPLSVLTLQLLRKWII
jgi:hypothetical protein